MTLMTMKAAFAAAFLMTAFIALADANQHKHRHKKPLLAESQRSAEAEADSADEHHHRHKKTKQHHRHKGAPPSLLKMRAKKTKTYPEIHEVESDFEKDFISDDNDFVLKEQVKRERNEEKETHDQAMLQGKNVQDEWRLEKLDYQHRREEENAERAFVRRMKKSKAQAAWAKRVLLQLQAKYRVAAEEAEKAKQEMLVAKAKADSDQQKLQKTENVTAEVERRAMLLEEEHRTEAASLRKSSLATRNLMDQYREQLRGVNEAKAAIEDLQKKLAEYEAEVVRLGGKASSSDSTSAVSVGGGKAAEEKKLSKAVAGGGANATTTEQEKGIMAAPPAEQHPSHDKSAALDKKLTGLPKFLLFLLFPLLLLPRP